jgi:hypothetical protein
MYKLKVHFRACSLKHVGVHSRHNTLFENQKKIFCLAHLKHKFDVTFILHWETRIISECEVVQILVSNFSNNIKLLLF